jgi:hypothetical protein
MYIPLLSVFLEASSTMYVLGECRLASFRELGDIQEIDHRVNLGSVSFQK